MTNGKVVCDKGTPLDESDDECILPGEPCCKTEEQKCTNADKPYCAPSCCVDPEFYCLADKQCHTEDGCCRVDITKHVCLGANYGETTDCIPAQVDNEYEECCDSARGFNWCPILRRCTKVEDCCDAASVWCPKLRQCVRADDPAYYCLNCDETVSNPVYCRGQCKVQGTCCLDFPEPEKYTYTVETDTCDPIPCDSPL